MITLKKRHLFLLMVNKKWSGFVRTIFYASWARSE